MTDQDLPEALRIAQEAVGVGWAGEGDLRGDPRRRVVVAESQGRILGVATAALLDAEPLLAATTPTARAVLRRQLGPRPAGSIILLLDLAAVAPASRRRGLYSELLADRLDWGRRAGASRAVAFGWAPTDGCHIEPAMARAGFARIARIEGHFREASVENGAICPECGNPCVCAAVLFLRSLS